VGKVVLEQPRNQRGVKWQWIEEELLNCIERSGSLKRCKSVIIRFPALMRSISAAEAELG
jgi:hypothetical protein